MASQVTATTDRPIEIDADFPEATIHRATSGLNKIDETSNAMTAGREPERSSGQALKAQASSGAEEPDTNRRKLEAIQKRLAEVLQETDSVRMQRSRIEAATDATIAEIAAATEQLQRAMDRLMEEKTSLSLTDARRTRLARGLRQFQDLHDHLMEVLESPSTSFIGSACPDNDPGCGSGSSDRDAQSSRDGHLQQRGAFPQDSGEMLSTDGMMPFRGPAGTKSLLNPQAPVVHPSDPRSRGHKPTSLKMGVPATDRATEWPPLSTAEKQSCERAFLKAPRSAQGIATDLAVQLARQGLGGASTDAGQLVALSDTDEDGYLNAREFTLMLYLMKQCLLGARLPSCGLRDSEVACIFSDRSRSGKSTDAKLSGPGTFSGVGELSTDSEAESSSPGTDRAHYAAESIKSRGLCSHGPSTRWRSSSAGQTSTLMDRRGSRDCPHIRGEGSGTKAARLHQAAAGPSKSDSGCSAGRHPSHVGHIDPPPEVACQLPCPMMRIFIDKVAVDNAKSLDRPFFSVCLRDCSGSLLSQSKETPVAIDRANRYIIMNHAVDLPVPAFPASKGSAVFFELRHWKAKSRKMSLRAWSAMPLEPLLREGGHASSHQVCTGSLHLPLYHKPVDPNRMRCKRINAKTFDLHVHVSQV